MWRSDFEFIFHLELCSSFSPTDRLVTLLGLGVGLRAMWWAGRDWWKSVSYLLHQSFFFKIAFGRGLSIMIMHRYLKVYSCYLLNYSMVIIPWIFCNMSYVQWFNLKKNKYRHIVGVLGLETIKGRSNMWLIRKCKHILSESRQHYLILWY